MPNPLKRAMADLINSIANIARTFDPNNTNLELSRTLLGVALGQGLEMADPAAAVEKILPEGYVDPMLAAQMGGGQGPPGMPPGGAPPLIPQRADDQHVRPGRTAAGRRVLTVRATRTAAPDQARTTRTTAAGRCSRPLTTSGWASYSTGGTRRSARSSTRCSLLDRRTARISTRCVL